MRWYDVYRQNFYQKFCFLVTSSKNWKSFSFSTRNECLNQNFNFFSKDAEFSSGETWTESLRFSNPIMKKENAGILECIENEIYVSWTRKSFVNFAFHNVFVRNGVKGATRNTAYGCEIDRHCKKQACCGSPWCVLVRIRQFHLFGLTSVGTKSMNFREVHNHLPIRAGSWPF